MEAELEDKKDEVELNNQKSLEAKMKAQVEIDRKIQMEEEQRRKEETEKRIKAMEQREQEEEKKRQLLTRSSISSTDDDEKPQLPQEKSKTKSAPEDFKSFDLSVENDNAPPTKNKEEINPISDQKDVNNAVAESGSTVKDSTPNHSFESVFLNNNFEEHTIKPTETSNGNANAFDHTSFAAVSNQNESNSSVQSNPSEKNTNFYRKTINYSNASITTITSSSNKGTL